MRWLFAPVPKGRVAAFRTLVYLFVAADIVIFTPWARAHAHTALYRPLLVGRLLSLPTPSGLIAHPVFWVLLALTLAAATGRAPRLLGWPVFLLYSEWMILAMSYGEVDQYRFGFLVALAVLPSAGRAGHGDPEPTEAGGWALRVTQLAVISAYFLGAWAKLRFSGAQWATSSVLAHAVIQRGTPLADALAAVPGLLVVSQFGIILVELLSPLVFVAPGRWRGWLVAFFYSVHVITFASIAVSFLPHLVAMAGFLPMERVRPVVGARRRFRARRRPEAVSLADHVP